MTTSLFESLIRFIAYTVEHYSLLLIGIVLFRLPTHNTQLKLWISSTILSSLSQFMLYKLYLPQGINNLIVSALTFLVLFVVYRIKLLHSFAVFISGYFSFMVIQATLLFAVFFPIYGSLTKVKQSVEVTSIAQIVTFVIVIFISFMFRKTNWGFIWLVDKVGTRKSVKQSNLSITMLSSISVIVLQFLIFWFISDNDGNTRAEFILSIATCVMILAALFIKIRKDIKEFYKNKLPVDYMPK